MFKWLRKDFLGKIKSGTEKHQKPIDVYKYMMDRLPDLDGFDKVCFWSNQCKGQVQIKPWYRGGEGGIFVGIKFPFKIPRESSLDNVFSNNGVQIPENWGLYKRKRYVLIFRTHKYEKREMILWLDNIFIKIFGCSEDYQVIGKIELGIWHSEHTNRLFQ